MGFKQFQISILDNIEQLSTITMVILGNFKDNYDAATATTTTAIKSMGYDLSSTQSCQKPLLLNCIRCPKKASPKIQKYNCFSLKLTARA